MKFAISALLLTTAAALATETETKSSVTVIPNVSGKATITIQANGKTETREINLGNATKVEIRSDDGAPTKGAKSTWLGVTPDALPEEVAAQLPIAAGTGLLVRGVAEDGPAAKAGLKKNDVLAKLDDQLLTNADQLRTLIAGHAEGDTVRLTYFRQGKEAALAVKLGSHEGGDARNKLELFFNGLKNGSASISSGLEFVADAAKQAIIIDRDGALAGSAGDAMQDAARQLENALKEGGLDEATVRGLKESFAKATEEIRKAAERAAASHGEAAKQIEETVRQSIDNARRGIEEQTATSKPQAENRGVVYLSGEVEHVGAVPISPDHAMKLSEAILSAGGLKPFANDRKVKVVRGKESFTVDLREVLQKGRSDLDMQLQCGDRIFVPERFVNF